MLTPIIPAVQFARLPNGEGLPFPRYASDGAAGIDLCATKAVTVYSWSNPVLLGTGFKCVIPAGYVGLIVIRSSAALTRGLYIPNQVGVIDSDYRGEIMVPLALRSGEAEPRLERGERVAQMLIIPCHQHPLLEVTEADLPATKRGEGGFGSTGV